MKRLIAILLIISLIITPFLGTTAATSSQPTAEFYPGDIVSVLLNGNPEVSESWENTRRMVVIRPSLRTDQYVTLLDLGVVGSSAWWPGGGSLTNVAQGTIEGSHIEPILGRLVSGQVQMGTLTGTWENIRQDYLPRLLNLADIIALGIVPAGTTSITSTTNTNIMLRDNPPHASSIVPFSAALGANERDYWTMICLDNNCEADEFDDLVYMMVVRYNVNNLNGLNANLPLASLVPVRVSLYNPDTSDFLDAADTPQHLVRPVIQINKRYIACRNVCPAECPLDENGNPTVVEGTPGTENCPPQCLVRCPGDCPMGPDGEALVPKNPPYTDHCPEVCLLPPCTDDCAPGTPKNPPYTDHCPPHCLVPPSPPTNEVFFPLILIGVLALVGVTFKFVRKKSVFDRI